MLVIYTDGSTVKNPGTGGWAYIILKNTEIISRGAGKEDNTTNNRMELMAVIQSLQEFKSEFACELKVITDSKYVQNAFVQGWLAKWKRNGWKTNLGPVKNQDLWTSLDLLVSRHRITWEWVRGHSGDTYNDMVDKLAYAAARN